MATTTNGPALTKQATTENYDVGVVNANSDLIADLLSHKGTDIASASTITIPAVGSAFDVTGTTGVGGATSTKNYAGRVVLLHFDSALVLTHGANWHLPNNATNITTQANDRALVIAEGSDAWRFLFYERATGFPVAITVLGLDNVQSTAPANAPVTVRMRSEVGRASIAGNTGASNVTKAITFATAFSVAPHITLGADDASVGGDLVIWRAASSATTGFTLQANTADAGNFANTNSGTCTWLAIGPA